MRMGEYFHLCFINEKIKGKEFYDFLKTLKSLEEPDNCIFWLELLCLATTFIINTDQVHIWCKMSLVILVGVKWGETEE